MEFVTVVFIVGGVILVGISAAGVILARRFLPSDGWHELIAQYPCDALCSELTWIRFRTMQMNPSFGQGSSPRSQYKGAYDGTNYYFRKTDLGSAAKRTVCIPMADIEIEGATGSPDGMVQAIARSVSSSNLPDVRLHVKDYEYPITVDGETFKKIQETS